MANYTNPLGRRRLHHLSHIWEALGISEELQALEGLGKLSMARKKQHCAGRHCEEPLHSRQSDGYGH